MNQIKKLNKRRAASKPSSHPFLPYELAAHAMIFKLTEKALGPIEGKTDPEVSQYTTENYLH